MATINGSTAGDTIRTLADGGSLLGLPDATDFGDRIDALAGDDEIMGGAAADRIEGGAGLDRIDAGGGNDTLSDAADGGLLLGGSGDDQIAFLLGFGMQGFADGFGGPGNDVLSSTGVDLDGFRTAQLVGDAGDDRITSGESGDYLSGGDGNDWIAAGGGEDDLLGGSGNDTLDGGASDDRIDGGTGIDTASYASASSAVSVSLLVADGAAQWTGTATGTDQLRSIENLVGSAGNDSLWGDEQANLLAGGAGNDLLQGGDGNDTLRGGAGNDRLDGFSGTDSASYFDSTLAVTVDLALATPQNTLGQGIDTLVAIENASGGSANDTLRGDGSANTLSGNAGNDLLEGRDGNDSLSGGLGDDTLRGGLGNDTLNGGDGSDLASYFGVAAAVRVDLALAGAQDTFGAGIDTIALVERLSGGAGDDQLSGNASANTLSGGDGNDVLAGRLGADTLTGGAGLDRFVFAALADAPNGAVFETITDFAAGDRIVLTAIDAVAGGTDQAFGFVGAAAFGGVAGQLRYAAGLLQGDVNGDGAADFTVRVGNAAALSGASFDL